MKKLPDKKPFPKPGEPWGWHFRYFDVGDTIQWRQRISNKAHERVAGAIYCGTVEKVKVNMYGRVTYYTKTGDMVMMEEVQAAFPGTTMEKALRDISKLELPPRKAAELEVVCINNHSECVTKEVADEIHKLRRQLEEIKRIVCPPERTEIF